jgi:hypothetical protein
MYRPGREGRFEYVTDLVLHIEEHNCAKGCRVPSAEDIAEYGPGGTCPVLAQLYAEEPMVELDDDGTTITCNVRIPL